MFLLSRFRIKWADLLAVGLPLIVYFLLTIPLFGWLIDDAGISFAYARNLALGNGLVSQPGVPPVEGFSNPLWIFILTPFFWLGIFNPFITSKAVSLVLVAVTFWLVHKTIQNYTKGGKIVSLIALLFLATNASFVIWTSSGLENPLLAVLVVALFYSIVKRDQSKPFQLKDCIVSGLLAAGIALTRPDGLMYLFLFPVIVFVARWKYDSVTFKNSIREIGVYLISFMLPFGAYFLFRVLYYGDIYPNTYHVKGGPTYSIILQVLTLQQTYLIKLQTILHSIFGQYLWPLIPVIIFVWLSFAAFRKTFNWKMGALVLTLLISGFTYLILIFDWMGEHRLATPFFPLLFLTLAIAIYQLIHGFNPASRKVKGYALFALFALLVFTFQFHWGRLKQFSEKPSASFRNIAEIFGHRFNRYAEYLGLEDVSFLVPDIGGTLYYSNLRIYDLAGLCDKVIAKTYNKDQVAFRNYIFDEIKPTFIHTHGWFTSVNRFDEDERFINDYVPIDEYEDKYAENLVKRKIMSGNYARKDAVVGKENILKEIQSGKLK